MPQNIFIQCAIYSAIGCAVVPVFGFLVNLLVQYVIGGSLSVLDRSGRVFAFIANYLTFPGVWYHELSHALFAFLTGAKVNEIALYKRVGNTLGHVVFTPRGGFILRSIQLSLASCAPVIMGALAEIGIYFLFKHYKLPLWGLIGLGYLAFCILIHMDMSGQDVKNYLRGIPVFFLAFFVIAYVNLKSKVH